MLTTVGQYYGHPIMHRDDAALHPILMLVCLAIFALIIIGVFYLARGTNNKKLSDKKPLDIIKERYAKGEITKAEFDTIKKDL